MYAWLRTSGVAADVGNCTPFLRCSANAANFLVISLLMEEVAGEATFPATTGAAAVIGNRGIPSGDAPGRKPAGKKWEKPKPPPPPPGGTMG